MGLCGSARLRASLFGFTCSLIAADSVAAFNPDAQPPRIKEPTSSQRIAGTLVIGDVDTRTFDAALEALPRRPDRIVVVSTVAIPPAFASQLRHLDGFVPVGSRVIYLRRESATLREAESGGPYLLML